MYHIVKRGESLWSIAQMHSVSLQELIAANPQIKDPNFIMVGEKILLPPGAGHIDVPGCPMPPRPNVPGNPCNPGMPPRPNMPGKPTVPCSASTEETMDEETTDTTAVMAKMISCDEDEENDDYKDEDDCNCVNDLCKRLAALPRPLIYVVRRGDTLAHIAECFELPLPELLRVNPQVRNPDLIHPGDKIFIPRPRGVIMPPNFPGHHKPQPRLHNVDKENTCPHCGRKL